MKKYVFILVAATVIIASACFVFSKRTVTVTDYAMNTAVSVTVKSRNAEAAAKEAIAEIKRIDSLMSATYSGSDVWKINSAPSGTYVKVSKEVYDLISLSLNVSEKSDGAFDITVNPLCTLWNIGSQNPQIPSSKQIEEALVLADYNSILLNPGDLSVALMKDSMSITLGAVAKGYAADRAAEVLRKEGVASGIIDLGGNIYVVGDDKRIGIQKPFAKRGEYFHVVTVSDCAVVTSGSYERYFEKDSKIYHHIIDPKTGYPAESDLKSATVICKNSALADALSTAFFVKGKDGSKELAKEFPEVTAILLTGEGETVSINSN